MTIKEWLTKHNISVEFYIRGFRFESPEGAAHEQVLFTEKTPKTFVTFGDVLNWLDRVAPDYIAQEAREELRLILHMTQN